MKYKSAMVTQASGSVGGMTFSHNRFGNYVRARAIPVNPNTVDQVNARNRFSYFAAQWRTLNAAARATWQTWADAVSKTDPLGDPMFLTAFQWYLSISTQRMQAGLTPITLAPIVLALTNLTTPSVSVVGGTDVVSVIYDDTEPWAITDLGFLLVFAGRPQNPTRNFYRGPWRLGTIVLGETATPPTPPATFTSPFPTAPGLRQWFRFVAQDSTGRPSAVTYDDAVAT